MTVFTPSRRMLIAGLFAVAAGAALADDEGNEAERDDEEDHERARRALEEGNVRPLVEILQELNGRLEGDIVGIEFEAEGERYIYEFKLVTPDGRLISTYVDARTGEILADRAD